MDPLDIIAKRLVILREAVAPSAAELCRRTGLSTNRWSQYENGRRPITLEAANALCDNYGVTLDWIYRGDVSGLPARLIESMFADA